MTGNRARNRRRRDLIHTSVAPHRPKPPVPVVGSVYLGNRTYQNEKPQKPFTDFHDCDPDLSHILRTLNLNDEDRDEYEDIEESGKKCVSKRYPLPPAEGKPDEKRTFIVTKIDGFKKLKRRETITMMSMKPLTTEESHHPMQVLKTKRMYHVRIEKVVNPSNFFMEFVLDPPTDCKCDSWKECLQKFYGNEETAAKYHMRTLKPIVGQMYVYFDWDTRIWERIRVHRLNLQRQTVLAYHLDKLDAGNIRIEWLYELHPRYGHWPSHPLNGGLKDIYPREWASPLVKPYIWSDDATNFFKEYVQGKLFLAYFIDMRLDRGDNVVHCDDEDRYVSASVILFEDEEKKGPTKPPINATLVEMGFALSKMGMFDRVDFIEEFYPAKDIKN